MIGLVRAATLCATLALGLVTAQAADKAFKRDDLADSAIKLEAQIKSEAGPVAKSGATLRTDADAAFKRSDFRTGLQILGQIAATAPDDSGNWLRLAAHHFPDLPDEQQRADLPSGARLDRRLHRLSARRQCRRRGGRACRARPRDVRTQAVASGARCVAALARPARGRRGARPIRKNARRARLPAAGLHRRFRLGLAARLLPVLRGPRQAHRLRAVPGAGRQRQAGADVGRKAALRRRAQARRALQHQSARRAAVHRQGKPAEIGRIQYLCARPQAVRALHRARLCAAAHRPARHSPGQRQHPGGVGQRVQDRRPQPDQHRDRQRFSARLSANTSCPASATSAASRSGRANSPPRPRSTRTSPRRFRSIRRSAICSRASMS